MMLGSAGQVFRGAGPGTVGFHERARRGVQLLVKSAGHPHPAREVFDTVNVAHPERVTSVQVVRSTSQLLAKKGRIERSRQHKAVRYTVHPGQDSATASGETADAKAVVPWNRRCRPGLDGQRAPGRAAARRKSLGRDLVRTLVRFDRSSLSDRIHH
ncbi:hypothetical protein [Streptomyces sp. NPDC046870]|uniref:hypothetical protein n=1 Tax=Streptomyces sp. NPDC046870 TaxID=3155135 RepID=UPI00345721BC